MILTKTSLCVAYYEGSMLYDVTFIRTIDLEIKVRSYQFEKHDPSASRLRRLIKDMPYDHRRKTRIYRFFKERE